MEYAPWVGMALTLSMAVAAALWHASQFARRDWVESHVDRVVQREAPYIQDKTRIMAVVDRYFDERAELVSMMQRIEVRQAELRALIDELLRRIPPAKEG